MAGFIYFIQFGEAGPIKVGHSVYDVEQRLAAMQVGSPEVLRLRGVIENSTIKAEKELHARFAGLRIRGEWFRPDPELLDYIRDHSGTYESSKFYPRPDPIIVKKKRTRQVPAIKPEQLSAIALAQRNLSNFYMNGKGKCPACGRE